PGARGRVQVCPGSIGTLPGIGAKACTQCCGRGITQKAGDSVEKIAASKETTKHLVVKRVYPLTTDVDVVVTGNNREVIPDIGAPDQFVNVRFQEERIAEAKRKVGWIEAAAGACICW